MVKRGRKTFGLFAVMLLWLQNIYSQPQAGSINQHGLTITRNISALKSAIQADSPFTMVPLSRFLHPLLTNFVYATPANFTHQTLYKKPIAYLRKEAAVALQKVQDTLQLLGLNIKIWDAYRPYSVTEKMWQIVPDERYAANPAKGSGHNRGIAIDLTLTDKTGKELLMPTGFDNFTDSAHHNFMNLPDEAIQNRKLLKTVMERYGFIALPTEWWHYSLPNPKRYDLLDIDFRELEKIVEQRKRKRPKDS